jgi:2-keto-4-pentenoate hydratase/2-oxohepta-3-ene-1,7-dioic acid hydratase in catechol pathway
MTMEGLVARNGGTTLDAARDALEQPDIVAECAVPNARLLAPIFPPAPGRSMFGPDDVVPWRTRGGSIRFRPELACVLGRFGRDLTRDQAATTVFGYVLVCHWDEFASSIGPWVATADSFDPARVPLEVRVDGEVRWQGDLGTSEETFPRMIAAASRREDVRPGDVYGAGQPRGGLRLDLGRLGPCAAVELDAGGLGCLKNCVGLTAGAMPGLASGRTLRRT